MNRTLLSRHALLGFLLLLGGSLLSTAGCGHLNKQKAGDRAALTVKGVSFSLAYAPAGRFLMGSPEGQPCTRPDKSKIGKQLRFMTLIPPGQPCHKDGERYHPVRLTKGFYIFTTEVTQELYEAVMGHNPSYRKDERIPTLPVDKVSWIDAVQFCNALSRIQGRSPAYTRSGTDRYGRAEFTWNRDADGYRLPTEAEWEYAARAGMEYLYAGSNDVDEVAWYYQNSMYGSLSDGSTLHRTRPVGGKKANAWGLYDMSGNVQEWTWDCFDSYESGSVVDPEGAYSMFDKDFCASRVLRGGHYEILHVGVRVAERNSAFPDIRTLEKGFRPVLSAP